MNERRSVAPEDLYRLEIASDPQLSPDGSRIAYVLSWADEAEDEMRSALWLVDSAGGPPRRFTQGPKRDWSPRWSPDGSQIAFLSTRGEAPQIYVMPVDGGEARQVTALEEGVADPVWSADGRRLAFTARAGAQPEPKEQAAKDRLARRPVEVDELKYKFDVLGQYRGRHSQLFTVSVDGGELTPLTSGPYENTSPAWSPDGSLIAFVSARHEHRDFDLVTDVFVVPASGGEPRRLTAGLGPAMAPAWSPDGRRIAYAGNAHPTGQFGLHNLTVWTVSLDSGELHEVTRGFDRSLVRQPPHLPSPPLIWSRNGDEILFAAQDGGAVHLFAVPSAGGEPRRIVGGDERTVVSVSAGRETRQLALIVSSLDAPSTLLLADTSGGQERQLARPGAELLSRRTLSRPERLTFRGEDGGSFEGWLIRPAGSGAGERHPLLLDVHGGPHGAWGPGFSTLALAWQALAGRGWAVLYVNPRGSAGYGEDFARYILNGWGERDFPDQMRAVDQVIEMGVADPDRLAVTGYSYGGYMTNWIIGHTDRFKAAVAGGCVSDLVSMYGTSDIGSPFQDADFGGPWWEQRERYARLSPLSYAERITTPLLLMHAEGDLRCPIGQSEEMFVALRRQRKPVQFVRFPGGNHLFVSMGRPSHRVEYVRRLVAWLDRWAGAGRAAAVEASAERALL
jgi:dipeptidyl aminopeptidase/acylaminoacyl peptidase